VKIDKYELLHGAALTQLTSHQRFTSLNKASDRYGHYLVNDSTRLWIKYSTADGTSWQFTFTDDDLAHIWCDAEEHTDAHTSVVLVCGDETICLLDLDDLWQIVDADRDDGSQAVIVSAPPNRSMRVKGTLGALGHAVAHKAFPEQVLRPVVSEASQETTSDSPRQPSLAEQVR
jgi:hypothetical protein